MKRKTVRAGIVFIVAAWAAAPGEPGIPGPPAIPVADQPPAGVALGTGLDTVISDLPPRVMTLRELVEALGRGCGMETIVGEGVTGEVAYENFPVTVREVLDEVLPGRGCLYLAEGGTLRVMREEALRDYFRTRAETRVYGARLTPALVERLLEDRDIVSTLGYLGLDPVRGVVHVRDLPCYADRVEGIIVAGGEEFEGVTL